MLNQSLLTLIQHNLIVQHHKSTTKSSQWPQTLEKIESNGPSFDPVSSVLLSLF